MCVTGVIASWQPSKAKFPLRDSKPHHLSPSLLMKAMQDVTQPV
jgi:hypothetical protein